MPIRTTVDASTSPANSTPVATTDVDLVMSPTMMLSGARTALAAMPAMATRRPLRAARSCAPSIG
jgi:hypothetical protein